MSKKRKPPKRPSTKPKQWRKRARFSVNHDLPVTTEEHILSEFGRRLQAAMVAKHWGQSELARQASALLPAPAKGQKQGKEFIRDRISKYVAGKRMPRPEGLAVLAKALGVEPSALVPTAGKGKDPSPMNFTDLGGGRVMLHINRSTSLETMFKINEILKAEDNV